jgi:hypothetical protein
MYRAGLLLAAAGVMIGASAIHAQNVDPDVAACNNVRDINGRVSGCSRSTNVRRSGRSDPGRS